MDNKKLSYTDVKLREFQSTCKLATRNEEESTSVLLRKGSFSASTASDITTLEYLENFRRRIGYQEKDENEHQLPSTAEEEGICEEDEDEEMKELVLFPKNNESCKELEENICTSFRLTAEQFEDQIILNEFWSLKTVDISDNELKSVRNLGAMPYLRNINASKNLLRTILEITPPVPSSLKEVDFSYNKISSIVELLQYWSLTHINLSHNKLTTMDGFSGLNYLQVLDVSYNKIETITPIDCPNLITLDLNSNYLESFTEYIGCHNLHYLNLQKNQLSSIQGLKYLTELTELNITENNIEDLTELERLESLLNLSCLKVHPNPITSMENWRLVLVHGLRQILWLDDTFVEPSELRAAENLFSPSYKKLAYLDYTAILLDRACQSSNTIFDSYCRNRPLPPILLIVGPPRSHCHTLALLLKEKFRNKVHLGGVHSTATTIEGSHPKLDIPISYESFQEMKNKGEFLATCKMLGRICGFAASQIARAAEKAALLVAAVPLKTALALREWNLNPKLVLALPSTPPEFPLDEERIETIRRSLGSEGLFESRKSSVMEPVAETSIYTSEEERRLVNFAEMLSLVPSEQQELDPEKLLYGDVTDPVLYEPPQRSILKSPRFELAAGSSDSEEFYENSGDVDEEEEGETGGDEEEDRERPNEEERGVEEQTGGDQSKSEEEEEIVLDETVFEKAVLDEVEEMENDDEEERGESGEYEEDEGNVTGENDMEEGEGWDGIRDEEGDEGDEGEEVDEDENENEDDGIERENQPESVPPIPQSSILSHKEAMTFSILQTKELYSQFHCENPGFFHNVIDTADLCESYSVLENMAMDALIKFKQESTLNVNRPQMLNSHAGSNQVDVKYFLADRMQKMKDVSASWVGGREESCKSKNGPGEFQTFQLNSSKVEQSEVLLTEPTCPRNLLDPIIHRPPITLKMRKLVELHEKRAKCTDFQKTSCLPYGDKCK